MPSTIFLRFNTRHDNIGDQLIFYYLYEEVRQYGDVHMVTSCPKFMERPVLRARESLTVAIKAYFFGNRNILFIEPPGARFIAKNPHVRPVLKTRAIDLVWKLLGTKFLLFGVSFDPKMSLHECHKFSFVGIRDHLSLAAAKQQDLSQARYCPDMAFLMPQQAKAFSPNLTALISFRSETPDAGEHHFADDLEKCMPEMFSAVAPFVKDFRIYHQVVEDYEFNEKIAQQVEPTIPLTFIKKMPTVKDLSELSLDCSIVVSNRLHVLLPAIAAGALPIALISSKHYKIHSIFESLGLGDCTVYIDGEKTVSEQIKTILQNAESIVDRNNLVFQEQSIRLKNLIKHNLKHQSSALKAN